VRLTITDSREYVGKLMCIDKTKSVFLQDALEVIDRSPAAEEACLFLNHELFTPHLLNEKQHASGKVLKYVGNLVVPGKHVRSIKLDHRLN
jgi:small nuclear ribonucleoprotein (snRNP)-like protein